MNLFSKFTKNNSEFKKRASMLLPSTKIAGISIYTSLLDKFPLVKSVSVKDWDFFFSIASVFISTIGMERTKLSSKFKSELGKIYGEALNEWSSDWNRAFKDCSEFFWRTAEGLQSSNDPVYQQSPKYRISDSIGSWLVWNLVGHQPETEDERKLVRVVGNLVSEEFINWWA